MFSIANKTYGISAALKFDLSGEEIGSTFGMYKA